MKLSGHDLRRAVWGIGITLLNAFLAVNVMATASTATNVAVQFHSRTWLMDDGLPQDIVTAVAQSREGYIWAGTPRGLARFDGVRFQVFDTRNTPGLKSFSITDLLQSTDGSLWIGTAGGGLSRWRDGEFSSFSITSDPRANNIMTIHEGQDGSMWVGTLAGLFHQDKEGWKRFTQADGLPDDVVRTICEAGDQVWIGTKLGVSVLQNGVITPKPAITSKAVRAILKDRQGRLWFALTTGLGCIKDGKFTLYTTMDGLADNNVSELYEDGRGELWIGTYGGLSRFVDGKFTIEKDNRGGFFDRVNSICEDQEGDIWIGARDGLHELKPKQFDAFTRLDGLAHNNVMSVLEDRQGSIWVGTWGGGISQLTLSGVTNYALESRPSNGLTSDSILGMCEDTDGSILVGTDYEGGTFRFNDGKFTRIWSQEQAMVDRVIRVIYRDRENNLWFGAGPGLILWNTKQKFLPASVIRCVLEDHEGALWVGTQDGLWCRKNGEFFNWSEREHSLGDFIISLYEDRDGTLWIGTGSTGLFRLRGGQLTGYTTRQGLTANDIFEILEDDNGWLWLSSSRGIFRVSKKNLDEMAAKKTSTILSIAYGRDDGMETVQCNGVAKPSAWKGRDGRLWFATAKGLLVTDPAYTLGTHDRPPPVLLEELVADKKHYTFRPRVGVTEAEIPRLRIEPGHGDLEFHYSALSFQSPEKTCFKYKLEGEDLDWTEVTRRVAYYNNLSPGNYRFRVKACNKAGVWAESDASVALYLAPHFWETWWFLGSAGLLVVAVAGSTVRYTTRRNMEEKLRRLEKQNAIEEERIRIARDMHDEIGAKLTKISFLGAMAKRKISASEEAGEQIDKMSSTAREVIRALDEIVWAVNPANDTLEHFATYLCRNATEIFENSPVQCQFNIPGDLPAMALGTDARHNILLATKEAMNNTVKHSGATNVTVGISVQPKWFEVFITDNGRGFKRGANGNSRTIRVGSGLTNMEQRLAAVGGSCEIESRVGEGTCIRFTVPRKDEHGN